MLIIIMPARNSFARPQVHKDIINFERISSRRHTLVIIIFKTFKVSERKESDSLKVGIYVRGYGVKVLKMCTISELINN